MVDRSCHTSHVEEERSSRLEGVPSWIRNNPGGPGVVFGRSWVREQGRIEVERRDLEVVSCHFDCRAQKASLAVAVSLLAREGQSHQGVRQWLLRRDESRQCRQRQRVSQWAKPMCVAEVHLKWIREPLVMNLCLIPGRSNLYVDVDL